MKTVGLGDWTEANFKGDGKKIIIIFCIEMYTELRIFANFYNKSEFLGILKSDMFIVSQVLERLYFIRRLI